jgi:hypothetical protein
MRCRLSPTADVPPHTSGAAMCQKATFGDAANKVLLDHLVDGNKNDLSYPKRSCPGIGSLRGMQDHSPAQRQPVKAEASKMIVSSQLFEAYLECHTKCWLRARAEPGTGNTYAEWARIKNETYYEDGRKRLLAMFPENGRPIAPPILRTRHGASQPMCAYKRMV